MKIPNDAAIPNTVADMRLFECPHLDVGTITSTTALGNLLPVSGEVIVCLPCGNTFLVLNKLLNRNSVIILSTTEVSRRVVLLETEDNDQSLYLNFC